jgi:hypothetical protein
VIVAQLVRAPDCGSGGRRFETGLSPLPFTSLSSYGKAFLLPFHSCIFAPEMGRSLSLIILFCYLFLIVQPAIPILNYLFQKDYYANTLCENKSRPSLKCEGKCALKKQLAQAEIKHSQQQSTEVEIEFSFPVPHCPKQFQIFPLQLIYSSKPSDFLTLIFPEGHPSLSSQPPELFS